MLQAEIKKTIQTAYSQLLQSRGWKPRVVQRLMIAEIAKHIANVDVDDEDMRVSDANCCVIEAGTGTGKTLAYTLAAIPLAKRLNKTLVISTATVALQEQIIYKDLPDIQKHSGLSFTYALAKGRQRYVCLSRLERQLLGMQAPPMLDLYPDEVAQANQQQVHQELSQRMLNSLSSGEWNGDRECWDELIQDDDWLALTVDRNQCSGRHCEFVSQCAFFKARDNLQQVDCIVANHDLVLADLALGGGAILSAPQDTIYIFDEAHHLSQKTLQHFAHHSRINSTLQWLEQCRQLPSVVSSLTPANREDQAVASIVSELGSVLNDVLQAVQILMDDAMLDSYSDKLVLRFANHNVPVVLLDAAKVLQKQFVVLENILQGMQEKLEKNATTTDKRLWEECWNLIAQYSAKAQQQQLLWAAYAQQDTQLVWARWIEKHSYSAKEEYLVHASPTLAQDILQEYLWQHSFAVILSSATLSSLGNFQRLTAQLGLPKQTMFHRLPSPFNYQNVVFNVPDIPCEPQQVEEHTAYIIDEMPNILAKQRGTLVLFSSRKQMQAVYQGLDETYQQQVMTQDCFSKIEVLRRHRANIDSGKTSTVFGLASFAEGVDLPGEYCQHVVICRIPFSVPGNPVEEALADWLKEQGQNPFMEIAVPDASQALIQACGRLLRNEDDSGEITMLDKRIVSKRYGQAMLDALPSYRRNIQVTY